MYCAKKLTISKAVNEKPSIQKQFCDSDQEIADLHLPSQLWEFLKLLNTRTAVPQNSLL